MPTYKCETGYPNPPVLQFIFAVGPDLPKNIKWIVLVEICADTAHGDEKPISIDAALRNPTLLYSEEVDCELVLVNITKTIGVRNRDGCVLQAWTATWDLNDYDISKEDDTFYCGFGEPQTPENACISIPVEYRGLNPSRSDVSTALGDDLSRAFAWIESGWRQFDGTPGRPLKNVNSNGTTDYGLMQVNEAPLNARWNWRQNISLGQNIISDKRNAARRYLDKHPFYDDDMLLRETIQRYNGGRYYQWDDINMEWIPKPKDGGVYVESVIDVYNAKPWQ